MSDLPYYKKHPERMRDALRRAYEWKRSLKIGRSCTDCGLECTRDNYPAFDWDHRPGTVKLFTIGGNVLGRQRVLDEVAKCDLRCRNCHALITHQRRMEVQNG